MNRVYLVATAASNMEAKVQELVDAVTKAGLIATVYKPLEVFNAADSVAEIKAGKSAVLMEKICADFLKQDFDDVDAVVVAGATGMNDVIAHKFNDDLASALAMQRFLPMAKMPNSSARSACSAAKSALLATSPLRQLNVA